MPESKIPISRAILWILVSTLLISGSIFMGWLYFLQAREKKLNDDQYRIVALVQSNKEPDALKTAYLAQLLFLSIDRPINLYRFDAKMGARILLQCPLVKKAVIKKIPPGTLYVDYEMRKPLALIGDFANGAIDEEGHLFPFQPFFTPKRVSTIYLGLSANSLLGSAKWGSCLSDLPSLQLAFSILRKLEFAPLEGFQLKWIDVSEAFADSFGRRQIVLVLEEESGRQRMASMIYLRLNPDLVEQNLANFRTLSDSLKEEGPSEKNASLLKGDPKDRSLVIDFRIPHLAFIKSIH